YRSFFELAASHIGTALATARAYEQERQRAEALAEIDRAKTAFFSNVSHEFRTPLTLMLGPLEDALAAAEPSPQRERIEVAHRNALRLLRLVNSLLDFARIEAGRIEARFVPTDLGALTAELASSFRSATEKAGLDLVIDVAPLPGPALIDRDMWEKIVLNLVSNAFKFTFAGRIAVTLEGADGQARLAVSDTGVGIAEAELPRLFDRFHRVEGVNGRSFEGSGIGLALVRELVLLHGGNIAVASEPGRGSTFTVTVPLRHGEASTAADAVHAPPATRAQSFVEEALRWLPDARTSNELDLFDGEDAAGNGRIAGGAGEGAGARVLLADDNADLRQYICRLLRERGYAVQSVADGEAALTALRHDRADILITDVMMPRLDGVGLLRAVRDDPDLRDLPVILLSARAGDEAKVEGLGSGADDYLVKPFSARELVARVAANLSLARLRREGEARLRELNATLETRVAAALAEKRLFADVIEATDAFVQIVDMDYRWLAINHAAAAEFARIFGVRPQVGQSMLDVLAHMPEHQAAVRAVWSRALGGEEFVETGEFGDPERDRRCYEMRYHVLRDATGRQTGAYQFVYDVTDRVREQERLVAAEEQLRQARKMEAMGQLTGGVAHDFNNLLTPIVGALDLLQRRQVGGEREQRLIGGAAQAADKAKTLVQRLLAFARRQPLQATAVDVGDLVRGMADLIDSTTGPQIRTVVAIAERVPPALADANQLEMALLNLSVNARDAMPDGGTLRIAVEAEAVPDGHRAVLAAGRYVRLTVTDDGQGMDKATLERAVEPFFSTKGVGKGTGLGLSMVHGLASQLGGALAIDSHPGHGTTVELWLPISDEQLVAADASGQHSGKGRSGTVLLVDDEELVRASTADMLSELGYTVVEAASGEEAIRIVRDGDRPDLLVTDHLMPGMTGVDLARVLRAEHPGLAALLVSGYADSAGVAADLPRLVKPFRKDDLAAALAQAAGPIAPD
ncbi:MAG: response regulator, partial [Sphingomonadaceae bacterium]|nr:response regulator [Sphingomonadaceae bacterium]